jgi:hypothetical protein
MPEKAVGYKDRDPPPAASVGSIASLFLCTIITGAAFAKACIGRLRQRIYLAGIVMENESIPSAFSRQHSGHKPPTALLILLEIISLPVIARFSWQRRGNKFLFWGLIAVMAMIAAMYFLMFRDVSLGPA